MYSLPANRLPGAILLTREDGWALRELIRPPLKTDDEVSARTQEFCGRLYDALVHLELEGRGEINFWLEPWDIWLLNVAVKAGSWEGADAILVQSWVVYHEMFYSEHPLELPGTDVVSLEWLEEEEPDAIREEGESAVNTGEPESGITGGIELLVDSHGNQLRATERPELSDDQ